MSIFYYKEQRLNFNLFWNICIFNINLYYIHFLYNSFFKIFLIFSSNLHYYMKKLIMMFLFEICELIMLIFSLFDLKLYYLIKNYIIW
jgi:hypothetical protein